MAFLGVQLFRDCLLVTCDVCHVAPHVSRDRAGTWAVIATSMVERLGGFKVIHASSAVKCYNLTSADALPKGGIVAMMPSNIVPAPNVCTGFAL